MKGTIIIRAMMLIIAGKCFIPFSLFGHVIKKLENEYSSLLNSDGAVERIWALASYLPSHLLVV